jgi:hypothetical protein
VLGREGNLCTLIHGSSWDARPFVRIWHPTYGVLYNEGEVIKRGTYASTVPALDINAFIPVRLLADCVGTPEVLQY